MANLLTSSEITYYTGALGDHWDTFSSFRTITVNKRAVQTVVTSNNVYPGYADAPNQQNITYTTVYSSFPAMVFYDKPKPGETFQEIKMSLGKGKCRIKVQQNCRDYIRNGITENIIVDGNTYDVVSDDGMQNFLGLVYYYFLLERTN